MKTVAVEDLMIECILTFCENAAELGCPKDQEVDMWFRYLSLEDARKVVDKMLEIAERPPIGDIMNSTKEKEKEIKMTEIELELDNDVVDWLCASALENIKNDREALINYAVNKIFKEIIETDGKCLEDCKCHKPKGTKKSTRKPKK